MVACGGGGHDSGSAGGGVGSGNPPSSPMTSAVSGTVTMKNGAPLGNVTITAYQTNDHSVQVATTDSNGNYAFVGLPTGPQVTYELWASKAGCGFYPSPGSGGSVLRSDHNGLFKTVLGYLSQAGSNWTSANFNAYDGRNHPVSLARTGQGISYASGDDGSMNRGVAWPGTRYSDNLDGTVTDRLTGLIWLKNANSLGTLNWADALTAVNHLAHGASGLTDGSSAGQWRLPNIGELESLVDVSRSDPALSAGHPFSHVADAYWSSTTYFGDTTEAWVIRFSDGRYMNDFVTNVKATSLKSVWPVRTGAEGAVKLQATGQYRVYAAGDDASARCGVPLTYPRFIDNDNGTVTDTVTGLIWLKKADAINLPWADALAAINGLASGQCGLTDGSTPGSWRMPNRAEMLSLSDRALDNHARYFNTVFLKADGSVDQPAIFTGFITAQFYWTATTDAADTSKAWTVYSCDFGAYDIPKANVGYALAVR